MSESLILVFARAPIQARTKTRMIPVLGAQGAADLHAWLVRRTLATVTGLAGVPVQLWCEPSAEDPLFRTLAAEMPVTLQEQRGRDLGERMSGALRAALEGSSRAVLIGTDCADLTSADLLEALSQLGGGADAVLGPVADGGYWLIGLRRWHASLFEGIPWGGGEVLARTRGALGRLGWCWHELPERHDVDRPEDLAFLSGMFEARVVG